MNNITMHCRKWRFFSSWTSLLAFEILYWYAKQKHSPCSLLHCIRRNLFHNHKSKIDFCFFPLSEKNKKEKRAKIISGHIGRLERSVIYIHLTTDWDKSSVQLRYFITSMRITLNSLNRFHLFTLSCCLCDDTIFYSFLPSPPLKTEKLTKSENLIKKILHLQWSIISWKLSNTQPRRVDVWERREENFKTNFCETGQDVWPFPSCSFLFFPPE